jgi:hypothetical protein
LKQCGISTGLEIKEQGEICGEREEHQLQHAKTEPGKPVNVEQRKHIDQVDSQEEWDIVPSSLESSSLDISEWEEI